MVIPKARVPKGWLKELGNSVGYMTLGHTCHRPMRWVEAPVGWRSRVIVLCCEDLDSGGKKSDEQ